MRLTPLRAAAARAAALLALTASCSALPIPVAAQSPAQPAMLEPYVSRARLDPAVVGAPARLRGAGARLLYPLTDGPLAARLHVGGYFTHAPADGAGTTTTQVGAAADLRLTARPIAGRVEPLLSLGAGALRTRPDPAAAAGPSRFCFRPLDVPATPAAPTCLAAAAAPPRAATRPALSPALGARIALLPTVALRVDARDLLVFLGGPRHNFELTAGLSLMR